MIGRLMKLEPSSALELEVKMWRGTWAADMDQRRRLEDYPFDM